MFVNIYAGVKNIINNIFTVIQIAFLRMTIRREATRYVKAKMTWHSA